MHYIRDGHINAHSLNCQMYVSGQNLMLPIRENDVMLLILIKENTCRSQNIDLFPLSKHDLISKLSCKNANDSLMNWVPLDSSISNVNISYVNLFQLLKQNISPAVSTRGPHLEGGQFITVHVPADCLCDRWFWQGLGWGWVFGLAIQQLQQQKNSWKPFKFARCSDHFGHNDVACAFHTHWTFNSIHHLPLSTVGR